jgi:CelD/BcsL family acetyltransferase involved in cellulose biosynthesis
MQVKIYPDFEGLPSQYARVFEAANVDNFFYSLAWFKNLASTAVDKGDQLRIYGIESSDPPHLPVAMLPMRYRSRGLKGLTPSALSGLANYYTPLFGPILNKSCPSSRDAIRELVRALCFDTPRWDTVDLHPLDPERLTYTELQAAFTEAGWAIQNYFCFGNWYLRTNGQSYDQYFETLPSALRNTITRKRKVIRKSGRFDLQILTGADDVDSAIRAYQKVYASSWKRPEPYAHFVPELMRMSAEKGSLRLGLAFFDQAPVAAQLWLVNEGAASIYKLAYDEQFSQYSIGSILTAHLMEHVIERDRVREVDYLIGDDPYKNSWMSHRRERWGVRAFNLRSLNGMFGVVKHIGGGALRKSLRKVWKIFKTRS